MISVEAQNLSKQYKDTLAIRNVNFKINKGEFFTLLGVNGAGKTTLIKILSCLLKPTEGTGIIEGKDIAVDEEKVKKIISLSPQETAIAPKLTVQENLELMCRIHGFSKNKTKKKVEEIAGQMKLKEVLHKKGEVLSGGYKRRLSIAMALITDPEVLFLDEPTLGLDVLARNELWEILLALKGKLTLLLTTHYLNEAQILSDKIGILKNGSLIDICTPQNLINKTQARNFEEAFIKALEGERQ